MFRFRIEPQTSRIARWLTGLFLGLSIWAFFDGALLECSIMLSIAIAVLARTALDVGYSIGAVLTALRALAGAPEPESMNGASVPSLATEIVSE